MPMLQHVCFVEGGANAGAVGGGTDPAAKVRLRPLAVIVIPPQMCCCWWLCGFRHYRRHADAGVEAIAVGGVADAAAEMLTLTLRR